MRGREQSLNVMGEESAKRRESPLVLVGVSFNMSAFSSFLRPGIASVSGGWEECSKREVCESGKRLGRGLRCGVV